MTTSKYKFEFTNDWFSHTMNIWEKLFGRIIDITQPIDMLEIGAWEGQSTFYFLENVCSHPDSYLTTIDPCPRELFYSNKELLSSDDLRKFNHIQSKSMNAFPDDAFDIIYVDGSHFPDDVMNDAVMSFAHLKVGGYLIFDDYVSFETNNMEYLTNQSQQEYRNQYSVRNIIRKQGLLSHVIGDHTITTQKTIDMFVMAYSPSLEFIDVQSPSKRIYRKIDVGSHTRFNFR